MGQESFSILHSSEHFHSEIYLSKRFIHRCIIFVVYEKLNQESYQTNLITRILSRGTQKFLRSYELSRFLYSLYGTYLDSSVTKWGSFLVYTLTIKVLIPENWEDPLKPSIDLALEMILNATWDHGKFFDNYFKEEVSNQISEIKDLINDKFRYAFEQFIQWMFHKEGFGESILGNEKKIEHLDNQTLSDFYRQHFLQQNRMVFFLDHQMNPLYQKVIDQFSDLTIRENESFLLPFKKENHPTIVRRKMEEDRIQQSWVFMGFRFYHKVPETVYPALLLFNNIFGGQSNSVLYRTAREEKGLCYFINSSLPAGVEAIIITAGIARKNQKPLEELILCELGKLVKTPISFSHLQAARELTLTSLYSLLDHPSHLLSLKIESHLFNRIKSLEDLIERIKLVTVEDICKVAGELYLDCVYMLKGLE